MFTLYKLAPHVPADNNTSEKKKDASPFENEAHAIIAELPTKMQSLAMHIWAKVGGVIGIDEDQCVEYNNPPLKGSPLLLLFKSVISDDQSDSVPFDRRRFIRVILDCGASEALPRTLVRQFVSASIKK